MNVKRRIAALLYHAIAKHLPRSYSALQLGQCRFRAFCGKRMLSYCGENVNIEKNALFSSKVSIGDHSGIGVNAKIYGQCFIGNNVMMGEDCTIITRNHRFARTDIPMIEQGYEEERPVYIGNDVWIGDRVTILPGVIVGEGSIIGAGSIVTRDTPPYSISVGNPAKVIRYRDK